MCLLGALVHCTTCTIDTIDLGLVDGLMDNKAALDLNNYDLCFNSQKRIKSQDKLFRNRKPLYALYKMVLLSLKLLTWNLASLKSVKAVS